MKVFWIVALSSLVCTVMVKAGDWKVSVAHYKGDKECAVSYTFDDGLAEHYTLVASQLESHGWRGTFWINGSKINRDDEHLTDTTRMTWPQLKDMSDRGHEISNHGWKHKNFARFTIEEIREDIIKNDSAIYANTGIMPRTFCYPNNNKKAEGRRIAEQNRVGTRLEQRSIGSKSTPENLKKWVEGLIETNGWGVGMTHGLTYGYDAFRNPQRLWDHFDYVKERENRVWVGTFREVVSYKKERDAIKLDVVQKKNRVLIIPKLDLNAKLFVEPLTLVIRNANGKERVEGRVIKKITVKQDGKKLPVKLFSDKAIFDFNPFGGVVKVTLK